MIVDYLKRFLKLVAAIAVLLIGVFLWGRFGHRAAPTTPGVLPPNDSEQIIVDPSRHSLVIVRPTGTQTLTLPDRQSVIDIRKSGKVDITSRQFGFEHRFFLGAYGSEFFRIAAGMDGFYWKRLDIGVGVAGRLGNYSPIVFAHVSYNIWSNCRMGLAYGTDRYIGGLVTVRL